MTITKDMSILEVVQKYPDTAMVFMYAGMGCLGCAAAHFENIEQGCMAHGIDPDALVDALNEVVEAVDSENEEHFEAVNVSEVVAAAK